MNHKIHLRAAFGSFVLLAIIGIQVVTLRAGANSDSAEIQNEKHHLMAAYTKLPISFEANVGQTESAVRFLSRGQGYTFFVTRSAEAVLVLGKPAREVSPVHPGIAPSSVVEPRPEVVLRMELVGAKRTPEVEGIEELPNKANYFIGNDPKKWRSNVPTYGKVKIHDVYPGVDLVYHGNQHQLEEDFIVAPGADVGSITMAVGGAKRLSLNAEGDLVLAINDGEVRLQKPVVYQQVEGVRRELPGTYQLKSAHQVSFQVAAHDESRPLIIDPVVVYATYLGGSAYDIASGIAADGAGNAYVTGYTYSANFPTTAGAFQTSLGGSSSTVNAFVTKLNPTLSALVYSTYFGGSGGDSGTGIAVDASGKAYVLGSTASANFPTTPGVVQPTYRGGGDAFVTKLNATGTALLYSTYLGGSGGDISSAIIMDSSSNAYVTGSTNSIDFPTTAGAFQGRYGGGLSDGFVTKLNPTASAPLLYSTYLGGSEIDVGYAVALDAVGNAYVAGHTASPNFPTTAGAFQPALNGGGVDAFVTKLNPTGSAPVYSTYLGGSGGDAAQGIAVDSLGNAYVSGYTDSTNFPTTAEAFQATFGGGIDAFATKLNPTGSAPVYSTYLGGTGVDVGYQVAVDSMGNAYVTGYAGGPDFPTTAGAFQTPFGGGSSDAFLTKLNATGSAPLLYSTLMGGVNNDGGQWMAVDPFDNAYVAGFTLSPNFPTTAGAFQTTYGGGLSDAFVTKISGIGCISSGEDEGEDNGQEDDEGHHNHHHPCKSRGEDGSDHHDRP